MFKIKKGLRGKLIKRGLLLLVYLNNNLDLNYITKICCKAWIDKFVYISYHYFYSIYYSIRKLFLI